MHNLQSLIAKMDAIEENAGQLPAQPATPGQRKVSLHFISLINTGKPAHGAIKAQAYLYNPANDHEVDVIVDVDYSGGQGQSHDQPAVDAEATVTRIVSKSGKEFPLDQISYDPTEIIELVDSNRDEQFAEEGGYDSIEVDPSVTDPADPDAADVSVTECGDDMDGDKQISMSMQDLLALINGIQQGEIPTTGDDGDTALLGDEYGNDAPGGSHSHVAPVAAVTATGNDMFSKGKEAPKVNGGGNPMEAALSELYAAVKARQLDELSKGTLASYAKKASAGASNSAFKAGMTRDDKQFSKHNAKAEKREAGLDKAIDKLSLKEANQMARKLRK